MNPKTIADLVRNTRLDPTTVIAINQLVSHIDLDDDIVKKYLTKIDYKNKAEPQESLNKLLVVNAILKQLSYDSTHDSIGEIRVKLEAREPLDEIIEYSALLLSNSFSRKQYKRIVKKAKKDIQKEIRKRQWERIAKALQPKTAFTSTQFYSRLIAYTSAIVLTIGSIYYFKYQDNAYYQRYGQYYEQLHESRSIDQDLENAALKSRFKRSIADSIAEKTPARNAILEQKLETIDNMAVLVGDPDSKVINEELYKAKKNAFVEFIKQNDKTSEAVRARLELVNLLELGELRFGFNNQKLTYALAAYNSVQHLSGSLDEQSLGLIYNVIYDTEIITQQGKKTEATNKATSWLESVAENKNNLGTNALRLLVEINTPKSNEEKKPRNYRYPAENKDKLNNYRTQLLSRTISPVEYIQLLHQKLADENKLEIKKEDNAADFYPYMQDYKAIAYYSNPEQRHEMFLLLGKVYLSFKDYEKGNAYFDKIITEVKESQKVKSDYEGANNIKQKAEELKVYPSYHRFMDAIFD